MSIPLDGLRGWETVDSALNDLFFHPHGIRNRMSFCWLLCALKTFTVRLSHSWLRRQSAVEKEAIGFLTQAASAIH